MATLVISYSRKDQGLVRAIVSLLKTALRDIEKAVFWDADIEPGDEWFRELQQHIERAPQLFVFWCHHSAASKEVRREWAYALARGKRVVPVLLDDTPLSEELAVINGIDLRQAVRHTALPFLPPAASSRARGPRAWFLAAAGLIALAALGYLFSLRSGSGTPDLPPPPTTVPPHATPPPGPLPTPLPTPPPVTPLPPEVSWILVPAIVVLALAGGWAWLRSRQRRRKAAREGTVSLREQDVVTAFAPFLTPASAAGKPSGTGGGSPRQGA